MIEQPYKKLPKVLFNNSIYALRIYYRTYAYCAYISFIRQKSIFNFSIGLTTSCRPFVDTCAYISVVFGELWPKRL
jgi:hypothetical protein